MTLQAQYPIGSTVLNGESHLAKVVDYRRDMLVVEGIGEFAHAGKWVASLDKTTRLSDGHFGLTEKFEYFTVGTDLYRALRSNPIVAKNNYRQGARMQMSCHLIDNDYIKAIGL